MDSYLTIPAPATARFTEKMSRFIGFAAPAETAGQAREFVADIQRRYCDARHICFAWMLGPERTEHYCTDAGEPSGTAGRPILGQINSRGLTNVAVAVVRYFGGIKLGTPGLIAAYRTAAAMALDEAGTVERRMTATFAFTFPYPAMNSVMTLVKNPDVTILERDFDNSCSMKISAPLDVIASLRERLLGVDGVTGAR